MATIFDLQHVFFGEFSYVTRDDETFYRGCTRCGGSGHYAFNGFDSICYLCGNSPADRMGKLVGDAAAAQKDADARLKARNKRAAKKEEERLATLRKRDANWQLLKDAAPEVWELLSGVIGVSIPFTDGLGAEEGRIKERDPFILSIADRLWHMDRFMLSDKQIAAVQKTIDKRKQFPIEDGAAAEAGRYAIRGQIVGVRVQEGDFGTSYKVTVKDERGFRVYVTLPKALRDEAYDKFLQTVEDDGSSIYEFGPDCWFLGVESGSFKYAGVKGLAVEMVARITPSAGRCNLRLGQQRIQGHLALGVE